MSRDANGCVGNGSQASGEERRAGMAEPSSPPRASAKARTPRRSKADGEPKRKDPGLVANLHPVLPRGRIRVDF